MDTTVYKRYLIQVSILTGAISIAKNGAHIGFAKSIDEAKSIIDMLTA